MQLPVYINAARVGDVTVTPQGRAWRAQVQMADVGRVVRLALYGRGGGVYLGIPEPDGRGGMSLTRVLRTLPEGAEYAAERDNASPPEKPPDAPEQKSAAPRHVVWMGGRPYYF